MGTSLVVVKEKGFWVSDGLLSIWLRLLALHIKEPTDWDGIPLAHDIRNQWLLASGVYFGGCIPVCLDEFCQTQEGKDIILEAVASLLAKLQQTPKSLDQDTLNLIGRRSYAGVNIETIRLIEIGWAFRDLLLGQFNGDPTDRTFMPGSLINSPYDLSSYPYT